MKVTGSASVYLKNRWADIRPTWTVNGIALKMVPKYAIVDVTKHCELKRVTVYAASQRIVTVTLCDDTEVPSVALRNWIDYGGKFSDVTSSHLMLDDFKAMEHLEARARLTESIE